RDQPWDKPLTTAESDLIFGVGLANRLPELLCHLPGVGGGIEIDQASPQFGMFEGEGSPEPPERRLRHGEWRAGLGTAWAPRVTSQSRSCGPSRRRDSWTRCSTLSHPRTRLSSSEAGVSESVAGASSAQR